jgi:predicted permease
VLQAQDVIIAVLPQYLLLLIGATLRRTGVLKREHDEGIMHLAFHVLYPCFILDKILGSDALGNLSAVAWPIALGFFVPATGVAIGWMVGKWIGLEKGTGQRTFALSTGLQNFGYTAIPIVQQLWPAGALAVLFVHNLGVELAIWSFGVMLLSGSKTIEWRKLVNGPVFAVIVGLLMVATGVDHWFSRGVQPPTAAQEFIAFPLRKAFSMLGSGAFPVAIMLAGAIMMDLAKSERLSKRIIIAGSVVRLLVAPIIILLAAKYLPIAIELRQVLVVQAAMPAAMTPILLARLYGGRPGIAVQIVLATTIFSFLTLPLVIAWGSSWIGMKPGLP